MDHWKPSGTLMTLCGTHRGVQVGAPAVIVVVFTTTLSHEVRDDIEVRMCSSHLLHSENIGVEELEIYIY